jgi:hypothetical protein
MERIKWVKDGGIKFPCYEANVGSYLLECVPIVKNRNIPYKYSHLKYSYKKVDTHISGWYGFVLFDGKQLHRTTKRKSKELAQKDVEKIMVEHLFCYGFLVVKELKRMGLLEEVLSEVGVDL